MEDSQLGTRTGAPPHNSRLPNQTSRTKGRLKKKKKRNKKEEERSDIENSSAPRGLCDFREWKKGIVELSGRDK